MSVKVENIYSSLYTEIVDRNWAVGQQLPTEDDLASRFGCSRSTISKVLTKLSHDGLVVRRTKAGTRVVRNSIESAHAPLLLDAFGFISPGRQHEGIRRMWNGFQDAAGEAHRRTLTLTFGLEVAKETEILVRLSEFDVKGAVIAAMLTKPEEWSTLSRAIQRSACPIVLVGTFFAGSALPAIVGDGFHAGYFMTRYLIARGLRRIGFLNNYAFAQTHRERFLGYRWAMEEAGLPIIPETTHLEWTMHPDFTDPLAEPTALGLSYLKAQQGLEAVVCGDYPVAAGCLRAARQLGMVVPQDLKVVGIDDMTSIPTEPALTTYQLPHEEMGRRAFALLAQLIAGEPPPGQEVQLRGQLIERNSA